MTESVLSFGRIKNAIAQEAPLHDVTRIYLFGSYARGEAGARMRAGEAGHGGGGWHEGEGERLTSQGDELRADA